METFPALLALCAGNSPVAGEFPSQRSVTRSCFLWSAPWINGWVKNREAGHLRRHRTHYDVIVMEMNNISFSSMKISLKSVPGGPNNNIPALYQIMACRHYHLNQWWLVYRRIYASPHTHTHILYTLPNMNSYWMLICDVDINTLHSPISRGVFSPKNSQNTLHSSPRPWGRDMGCFPWAHGLDKYLAFALSHCVQYRVYYTAIYWESVVLKTGENPLNLV